MDTANPVRLEEWGEKAAPGDSVICNVMRCAMCDAIGDVQCDVQWGGRLCSLLMGCAIRWEPLLPADVMRNGMCNAVGASAPC